MDDQTVGRRSDAEGEWAWEPPPRRAARWPRRRALLAAAAVLALLLGSLAGIVLATCGDNDDRTGGGLPPPASPSPSEAASPTPAAISPTDRPSALTFVWWDKRAGRWEAGDVTAGAGYAQGETVPFLIRFAAAPGTGYRLVVRYSACDDLPGSSFDFLANVPPAEEASRLRSPGPRRLQPDATILVPDDPVTAVDDAAGERRFRLWGATFAGASEGPLTACAGARAILLEVIARGEAVTLIWGGHLASSSDWPGQGAAGRDRPFAMGAEVSSFGSVDVQVPPAVISP